MSNRLIPDTRLLMVCAGVQGILAILFFFVVPGMPIDGIEFTIMASAYLLFVPFILRNALELDYKYARVVVALILALGGMSVLFHLLGVLVVAVEVWLAGIHSIQSPSLNHFFGTAAALLMCSLALVNFTLLLSVCQRALSIASLSHEMKA